MTLFLEYAWKTIAKIATDVIEKMDILVSLYFDFRPSNNLILKYILWGIDIAQFSNMIILCRLRISS